ncbi:MAG: enoyl-CoA hydratase [Candidatus Hydrogenedentota bacterium]|nr:MAG: enoyl-CoA hydratase [Candidatus Hydrogenedentota bacterium]
MSGDHEANVIITWDEHGDKGRVARVMMHNPARLNVLDTSMATQLAQSMKDVVQEEKLRAVVVTGAGDRAFIGGADIHEFSQLNPDSARTFITNIHLACQAIRDCPVPVIARIHGYCLGAGMEVAAACDMRIATIDSLFGMPEVQVGVPSVIEAALLPRIIGWGKTNELLLTGQTITAHEAKDFGFVERLVSTHALDMHLQEWIDDIVIAAPNAVRSQKKLIRTWEDVPLDQAIEAGIDVFSEAFETDEVQRFTAPFLNKKKKKS